MVLYVEKIFQFILRHYITKVIVQLEKKSQYVKKNGKGKVYSKGWVNIIKKS